MALAAFGYLLGTSVLVLSLVPALEAGAPNCMASFHGPPSGPRLSSTQDLYAPTEKKKNVGKKKTGPEQKRCQRKKMNCSGDAKRRHRTRHHRRTKERPVGKQKLNKKLQVPRQRKNQGNRKRTQKRLTSQTPHEATLDPGRSDPQCPTASFQVPRQECPGRVGDVGYD